VVALEARPYGKIPLNTNGWDREKFSIAAWCLRWCRSAGGFGPRGCGPDDFKKEGRCSDERRRFAKGDPAALPKGDRADVGSALTSLVNGTPMTFGCRRSFRS
jgi:hypothetical protein